MIYLAGVQLLLCDFATKSHSEKIEAVCFQSPRGTKQSKKRTMDYFTVFVMTRMDCFILFAMTWYNKWVYGTYSYNLEKCEVYLVASDNYWSSSPDVSDSSNAWNVNFKNGNDNTNNKNNNYLVRCVRDSKKYV